jgi:NAD+ synthase (glutamine-hydrolysing)
MNYGFVRVAAAVPEIKGSGCKFNSRKIIELINKAESMDAQFVVFPSFQFSVYLR